ncbi:MAG: alpha/beta hydrolase, partial [Bacteroidota bacterium]
YIPTGEHPTFLSLSQNEEEWEIYSAPNHVVKVFLKGDSISFSGDFVTENQHLQSEKLISNEVGDFLGQNWYALHRQDESEFIKNLDSLELLFIQAMENNPKLSANFRAVNMASIRYSFNRMVLRYPRFHQNFTGNQIELTESTRQEIEANLDAPEFIGLPSYQKHIATWLDLATTKAMRNNNDASVYRGLVKTQITLDLIQKTFKSQHLQEHWSLETIKSHIEQNTWINGIDLLENLATNAQTPSIQDQIQAYKSEQLDKRKDLETFVYKTVNGFQLEAYIFRPENFDPNKRYAALAAFHGGGWISGNAGYTIGSGRHAAQHGLVGFSVEYRLANFDDITPEEAMQDTRDFIIWMREHADSLSIDPDRIIAKGVSAGGHLVSAISVIQNNPSSVPNAAILVSPAIDVQDGYFKSLLREGQDPVSLSALDHVSKDQTIPKTILLQGRTDNLTPTSFAEALTDKMNDMGHAYELVIYEGCGHLFTPSHLDDTGYPQSDPEIAQRAFARQAVFYEELGYAQ